MKVCINNQGHSTKMLAIAINSKTLKKNLFQNQKAYDFESWHETQRIVALCLYKSLPLDEHDLFYGKVNISSSCIWMGKIVKMSLKGNRKWASGLKI